MGAISIIKKIKINLFLTILIMTLPLILITLLLSINIFTIGPFKLIIEVIILWLACSYNKPNF